MNMQELVDKFANGTISESERSELYAAAENNPELQGTLSELEKVDDLLEFTKSEESKRLFGYLNKVEATVLATMATTVPIAASHSGWWYGAAGTVGGLAVAGAIWLMSTSPKEQPATPQNTPIPSQQAPVIAEKTIVANEAPKTITEPATIETKKSIAQPDNSDKHPASKESTSLTANGKSAGNNDVTPELNAILAEISGSKGNTAALADKHFKAAMLYKEMKNSVETKSHLTQARTYAQSIHLSETAAKALAEIALLEYDEGNTAQAQQKLITAVSELKAINSPVAKRWEQKLSEIR